MYLINRILYKFKAIEYANKGNKNRLKTKYIGRFKGYYVYRVCIPNLNGAYVGIPQTILINDNEIRWATGDEVSEIADYLKK